MRTKVEYLIEGAFTLNSLIESGVASDSIEKIEGTLKLPSSSRSEKLFYVGLLEIDERIFISFPKSLNIDSIKTHDVETLISLLISVSKNTKLINRIPDGNFLRTTQQLDQLSRLGLANFIIKDFIENGDITFKNHNIVIDNRYEPDWVRTIDKVLPVSSQSGHIYEKWFSKKRSVYTDNVIKKIHDAVLNECLDRYGEILGYDKKRLNFYHHSNDIPKHAVNLIDSKLRDVYVQRDVMILKALKQWLQKSSKTSSLEFFGTRYFHMIWEEVCSYLLIDCKAKDEWKSAFHRPVWNYVNSQEPVYGDSFEVDIISETVNGKLILADAKYYDISKRSNGILGVGDVSKQINYEQLLLQSATFTAKFEKEDNLVNLFIFPSDSPQELIQLLCTVQFPKLYSKKLYGFTFDTRESFKRYLSQNPLSSSCILTSIISELH